MALAPPLIEYAAEGGAPGGDRLLRHVVAWSAIVYGGAAVVRFALHAALVMGWVASPPNTSYGFGDGWGRAGSTAHVLGAAVVMVGGAMLLGRLRKSAVAIRTGAACLIVALVLNAVTVLMSPYFRLTPATAAEHALHLVIIIWLPLVLVLLTLPPLARRMM